jgi:hypothetical protein
MEIHVLFVDMSATNPILTGNALSTLLRPSQENLCQGWHPGQSADLDNPSRWPPEKAMSNENFILLCKKVI